MADESGLGALLSGQGIPAGDSGLGALLRGEPEAPVAPQAPELSYRALPLPNGDMVRVPSNFSDEQAYALIRKQRPDFFHTPTSSAKGLPSDHSARQHSVHKDFQEALPSRQKQQVLSEEEKNQKAIAQTLNAEEQPDTEEGPIPMAFKAALPQKQQAAPTPPEPRDPSRQGFIPELGAGAVRSIANVAQTVGEYTASAAPIQSQVALEYADELRAASEKMHQPITDADVQEAAKQGIIAKYGKQFQKEVGAPIGGFLGQWLPAIATRSVPAVSVPYAFAQMFGDLAERAKTSGKDLSLLQKSVYSALETAVFEAVPGLINRAGVDKMLGPTAEKLSDILMNEGLEAAYKAAGSVVSNIAKTYVASVAGAVPAMISTESMTRHALEEPQLTLPEAWQIAKEAMTISGPMAAYHGVSGRAAKREGIEKQAATKAAEDLRTEQMYEDIGEENLTRQWPEMRTEGKPPKMEVTAEDLRKVGITPTEPAPPTGPVNLAQPVDWAPNRPDGFPNTVSGLEGFIQHHEAKLGIPEVQRNPEVLQPIQAAIGEANTRLEALRATAQPPEPTAPTQKDRPSAQTFPFPETPWPVRVLGLKPSSALAKRLDKFDMNNPEHVDAITAELNKTTAKINPENLAGLEKHFQSIKPVEVPEDAIQIPQAGAPDGSGGPQPIIRQKGRRKAISGKGVEPSGQGEQAPEVKAPEEKVEPEPNKERRVTEYLVTTEDEGDIPVKLMRHSDGSVTMFDTGKTGGTYEFNKDFAANKSDEELFAYQFEPLGFKSITAKGAEVPKEKVTEAPTAPVFRTPTKQEAAVSSGHAREYVLDHDGLSYVFASPPQKGETGKLKATPEVTVLDTKEANIPFASDQNAYIMNVVRNWDGRALNRESLSNPAKWAEKWHERVPESLREPLLKYSEAKTHEEARQAMGEFYKAVETLRASTPVKAPETKVPEEKIEPQNPREAWNAFRKEGDPEHKELLPEAQTAWKEAFNEGTANQSYFDWIKDQVPTQVERQAGEGEEVAPSKEDYDGDDFLYSLGTPTPKEELVDRAIKRLIHKAETGEELWVPGLGHKQVQATLRNLLTQRDAGTISEEQMHGRLNDLLDQITIKAAERKYDYKTRARGADYIRQRLLQAKRQGVLDDRAVDMTEWFLKKNPALADDLGFSIKGEAPAGQEATAGHYDKINRVATLIAENAKDTTAIHEILHHIERMMPANIRSGVGKAWLREATNARDKAIKSGDEPAAKFFNAVISGDTKAAKEALQGLSKEHVENHYQHFSPSEFWAVNGARILENRYNSSPAFLKRLANWLKEFSHHVRGTFGLKSDAPILRAIDMMLKEKAPERRTERLLTEEVGKQDAQMLASYIGEKAKTADLTSLEEAKRRVESGEKPDTVRRSTGWFKPASEGEKGKWRFEIDDRDVAWKKNWNDMEPHGLFGPGEKLGDVLDAPTLFAAYPELKDVEFKKQGSIWDWSGSTLGWFDADKNRLVVTPNNKNDKSALQTALHEMQHWIQDKEEFTPGGNARSISLTDAEALDKYEARLRRTAPVGYDALQAYTQKAIGDSYLNSPQNLRMDAIAHVMYGEDFAALPEATQRTIESDTDSWSDFSKKMSDAERAFGKLEALRAPERQKTLKALEDSVGETKATLKNLEEQKDTIEKEHKEAFDAWFKERKNKRDAALEHYHTERNRLLKARSALKMDDPRRAELMDEYNALERPDYVSPYDEAATDFKRPYYEAMDDLKARIEAARDAARSAEKEYDKETGKHKSISHGLYTLIGGEREARDVEARIHMTPEERKELPPYTQTNIREQEVIIPKTKGIQEEPALSKRAPEKEEEDFELTKIEDPSNVFKAVGKVMKRTVELIISPRERSDLYDVSAGKLTRASAGLTKLLKDQPSWSEERGFRADYIRNQYDSLTHLGRAGIMNGFPVVNTKTGEVRIVASPRFNLHNIMVDAAKLPLKVDFRGREAKPLKVMGDIFRIKMGEQELQEVADARSQLARLENLPEETLRKQDTKDKIAELKEFIKDQEAGFGRERLVKDEHIMWANNLLKENPKAQDILDRWQGLNKQLVKFAKDSKYISPETAEIWDERWYVPMYKSLADIAEKEKGMPERGSGGARTTGRIKTKKGSRQAVNIWENMFKHYNYMLGASMMNNVTYRSYKQLEPLGLAERTSPKDKGKHIVGMKDEGKDVFFRVEDPDAFMALTMLHSINSPLVDNLFSIPAKLVRETALAQPGYWANALLKEPIVANWTTSATTPIMKLITPAHAMYEIGKMVVGLNKEGKTVKLHGITGYYGAQATPQRFSQALAKEGTVQKAAKAWQNIHNAFDEATRIVVYKSAVKEAKRMGITDPQDIEDWAALQARRFADFSTHGTDNFIRQFGKITPFFHAHLVSMDTLMRAYSGQGLPKAEADVIKKKFRAMSAMAIGFTAAYTLAQLHDKRYRDLPINEWSMNYITGWDKDGHAYKLPAPYEPGFAFKFLTELFIRQALGLTDSAEAKKAFHTAFMNTIMPPGIADPTPPGFRGITQLNTNVDLHSGLPIESLQEQNLLPEDRDKRATLFGRAVGAEAAKLGVDLSPDKFDSFMRSILTEMYGIGAMAADMMWDAYTGKRGMFELPFDKDVTERYPLLKKFMTNPRNISAVPKFYEMSKPIYLTMNSINKAAYEGNKARYEELINDPVIQKRVELYDTVKSIKTLISDKEKALTTLEHNTSLNEMQKRKLYWEGINERNELARKGLEIITEKLKNDPRLLKDLKSTEDEDTQDLTGLYKDQKDTHIESE